MLAPVFITSLVIGAAMLAFWADARLGVRRPQSLVWSGLHGVVALAAMQLGTAATSWFSAPGRPLASRVFGFVVILVPTWVYAFLAASWLLRLISGLARRHA
jgi:hypothetical protein